MALQRISRCLSENVSDPNTPTPRQGHPNSRGSSHFPHLLKLSPLMLADSRHPKVSWTGAGSSQGTGGVKCHRLPFMYTNTPPSSPSQRFEIPIRLCCLPRRGRNARSPQYKGGLGGGGGAEPCSQGRDSGVGGGAPSPVCSCANTARWGLGVRSDSPPFSFLSPPGVLLR